LKDDRLLGENDPVFLDEVTWADHLYRTATTPLSRQQSKAYRDRLIRRCYEGGDVTRKQLAEAAHLSLSSIDAIRRAGRSPQPRPKLRIVR
jgi:hypothetical protein